MIVSFRKFLLTILSVACFSGVLATDLGVNSILQSGSLPTGEAVLAAIDDKEGKSVSNTDLQNVNFWQNLGWNPLTGVLDSVGNPWLKKSGLPVHRIEQENYSTLYDTTVIISTTDDYKKLIGLYGYKISVDLSSPLNFGGDTIYPLFNVVRFNGNGHTIENFTLRTDCSKTGLFATVSDSVHDLTVKINSLIGTSTSSSDYVGVLVGSLSATGKIRNCTVIGTSAEKVLISGNQYIGGIVGYAYGTIENCKVYNLALTGAGDVGGLAGKAGDKSISDITISKVAITCNGQAGGITSYLSANITNCKVDSTTVSGYRYVGGLVGDLAGSVSNSTIDSSTIEGTQCVGGLIGHLAGSVFKCTVDSVSVKASDIYAGGLFGYGKISGTVDTCSVTRANITASTNYAGGLYAFIESPASVPITKCSVKNASITSNGNVGGLSAEGGSGNISYTNVSKVRVVSKSNGQAGGLSASTGGKISNCTIDSSTITGITNVGGLAGWFTGTIYKCYADSLRVTASSTSLTTYAGGLYGYGNANGAIDDASVTRAIITSTNGNAGGLSSNVMSDSIYKVKVAKVRVDAKDQAGGLTAVTGAKISNCTIDSATITGNDNVGGLAGWFTGTIYKCYADSLIVTANGSNAGGLYGRAGERGGIDDASVTRAIITSVRGDAGGLSSNVESGSIYKVKVAKVRVDAKERAGGLTAATGVNISNCTIDSATITGYNNVGGLAGWFTGTIYKCYADSLIVTANNNYAGGLYGYGDSNGGIDDASVTRAIITSVKGDAGGLCPWVYYGNISNAKVSKIRVEADEKAGGLTGLIDGNITNCKVDSSTIIGKNEVGGLAGYFRGLASDCSVDSLFIQSSGIDSDAGGIYGKGSGSGLRDTITNVVISSANGSGGGAVGYCEGSNSYLDNITLKSNITVSAKNYGGGLVGYFKGNSVKNINININDNSDKISVTVTGTSDNGIGSIAGYITNATISNVHVGANYTLSMIEGTYFGGIAGYFTGTMESCSVVGKNFSGKYKYLGGLVGYGSGKISSSFVSNCTIKTTNTLEGATGGIVGEFGGEYIHSCAVIKNTSITGGSQTGGIVGSAGCKITNSHVDGATLYMSGGSNFGGIVGYSGGEVSCCLVSGTTIKSDITSTSSGYIGGIVGYNGAGDIKNCVAMINYFDIKAKYAKNGDNSRLGRIVGTNASGSLSNNYGWVETYIKYYHKRFGINWNNSDYNKGTGNVSTGLKNGENLYAGSEPPKTVTPKLYNNASFWTDIGFNAFDWDISRANSKYYPCLTFLQSRSDDIDNMGQARGFEYEKYLIDGYTPGNYFTSEISVFTPQILFANTDGPGVYVNNTNIKLYTDILLEEGSESATFWSVDLNGSTAGTAKNSLFGFANVSTSMTSPNNFYGNGHSIDGYKNISNTISEYEGIIHAPDVSLSISKLEVDFFHRTYVSHGDPYPRHFGSLISSRTRSSLPNGRDPIYFEDIYVKNAYIYSDRISLNQVPYGNPVYTDCVGAIGGLVYNVSGERLAVYLDSGYNMYSDGGTVAGVFGYIPSSNLTNIAIYLKLACLPDKPDELLNISSVYQYYVSMGGIYVPQLHYMSYIANHLSSTCSSFEIADGGDYLDGSKSYSITPSTYNKSYPTRSTFYETLVHSGIKGYSAWNIPDNVTNPDKVYLNRTAHSWYE